MVGIRAVRGGERQPLLASLSVTTPVTDAASVQRFGLTRQEASICCYPAIHGAFRAAVARRRVRDDENPVAMLGRPRNVAIGPSTPVIEWFTGSHDSRATEGRRCELCGKRRILRVTARGRGSCEPYVRIAPNGFRGVGHARANSQADGLRRPSCRIDGCVRQKPISNIRRRDRTVNHTNRNHA